MAYQKLQVSSSLAVIPSDTVDIPNPSSLAISSTTVGAAVTNKLVDTGQTFLTAGIYNNAIVYNTTDGTAAYVTAVDSDTVLSLSADIMATSEDYTIYNEATKGAVLYAGHVAAADLAVIMAGGSATTFKAAPSGAFLPIQVTRLKAGPTYLDILALW